MSTSRLPASCIATQFLQHAPPIRIFVTFSPALSLVSQHCKPVTSYIKSHAKTARPHIADKHLDLCTNALRSMSAILDLHISCHRSPAIISISSTRTRIRASNRLFISRHTCEASAPTAAWPRRARGYHGTRTHPHSIAIMQHHPLILNGIPFYNPSASNSIP